MKPLFLFIGCLLSFELIAQESQTTNTAAKPKTAQKAGANQNKQLTQMAKEYKISADESFKDKDYALALALYLDELSKKPEDVDLRIKIGQCYLETDIKKSNAIDYFEYALAHNYKNNDIALFLGRAYMYAERFDEAITKFEQYKSLEFRHPENVATAEKYLKCSNLGKQFKANPIDATLQNMGDAVNSTKSDNFPIIDPFETALIFNSNRTFLQDYGEFMWDVVVSENKNNKWKKAHSLSTKIHTVESDYLVGSSPDLENLLIRPETFESSGNIYYSPLINKKYDALVRLTEPVNSDRDIESAACFSATGDTIYFSSNRPGSYGGLDIFYSIRIGSSWSIPKNLGPNINTTGDEDFPNIMKDGKTLYFASDGLEGIGGFDIFVSKLNISNKEWGTPKNIGYPLNTTYDDFNISFAANPRYAYVAQVKNEGMGESDIYRVVFNKIDPPLITYTGLIAVGDTATAKPLLDVAKNISIKVLEKKTEKEIGDYALNKDSHYALALEPGSYSLIIEAEGIKKYSKTITIADKQLENPIITSDIYIK